MIVSTPTSASEEYPRIAMPSAVADAGGCCIFRSTIRKTDKPTARPYRLSVANVDACGIVAQREPIVKPTRCPPMTLYGRAVRSNGLPNTMNALAPRAAMMTACSRLSTSSMKVVVIPATRLCVMYAFQPVLNLRNPELIVWLLILLPEGCGVWGRGASRAPWLECSVQRFPWLLSILLLAGDRRKKQYCVPAAVFGGGGWPPSTYRHRC